MKLPTFAYICWGYIINAWGLFFFYFPFFPLFVCFIFTILFIFTKFAFNCKAPVGCHYDKEQGRTKPAVFEA